MHETIKKLKKKEKGKERKKEKAKQNKGLDSITRNTHNRVLMDEKSKTFCNDRHEFMPLKERDNEEKEKQNRRRNKIIFKLPESKKYELEDRKGEDIKKFIGFGKGIFKINFDIKRISRSSQDLVKVY